MPLGPAIGNPPTDTERSWFEKLCNDGYSERYPQTTTIKLAATDSPAVTGERTADKVCACLAGDPGHIVSSHLVNTEWIEEAIRDHGKKSPYVIAKVHAKFPKGAKDQIIPSDWVDAAAEQEEPEGPGCATWACRTRPTSGWYGSAARHGPHSSDDRE
ncbi:hypothetical protein AB0F17_02890 [Nonomuraea sp. NPDC026600]|uniref:hypothetical protein n=1 Tax=Nonomuraea sp. NPDC026600 TaxID=3155363 RepID=UPI0033E4A2D3